MSIEQQEILNYLVVDKVIEADEYLVDNHQIKGRTIRELSQALTTNSGGLLGEQVQVTLHFPLDITEDSTGILAVFTMESKTTRCYSEVHLEFLGKIVPTLKETPVQAA